MRIEELIKFTKDELSDLLGKPAAILYSDTTTLRKGDIYLLGTNPGGSDNYTLYEDLKGLETKTTNAYLDEVWETKNRKPEAGKAVLQKRIQELFENIGYDLKSICASNLIFFKSVSLETLEYNFTEIANRCWPIHEKILKIVQPKVIIVFGNSENDSPYQYLRKKFRAKTTGTIMTGHGKNKAKYFNFKLNGDDCCVIGLPHLSRFSISNKSVYNWIQEILKTRGQDTN